MNIQSLNSVFINSEVSDNCRKRMDDFNKLNGHSFEPGMHCICLGFTGMENEFVLLSPISGRIMALPNDDSLEVEY